MSTTPFYDELLDNMPEGLVHEIFEVLTNHVGEQNKITLHDLTVAILGKFNTTTERQMREAIEMLRRDHRVPVLSESGKSGRWLAASKSELEACVAEMEARHRHLGDVIRSMRQASIPAIAPEKPKHTSQLSLWR